MANFLLRLFDLFIIINLLHAQLDDLLVNVSLKELLQHIVARHNGQQLLLRRRIERVLLLLRLSIFLDVVLFLCLLLRWLLFFVCHRPDICNPLLNSIDKLFEPGHTLKNFLV